MGIFKEHFICITLLLWKCYRSAFFIQ